MVHVQVHGPAAFCRRVHRAVDVADRADDEFIHVAVAHAEVFEIINHALVHIHGLLQVRVAVGNEIPFADPVEVAHAAVGPAFDADVLPQVIVA